MIVVIFNSWETERGEFLAPSNDIWSMTFSICIIVFVISTFWGLVVSCLIHLYNAWRRGSSKQIVISSWTWSWWTTMMPSSWTNGFVNSALGFTRILWHASMLRKCYNITIKVVYWFTCKYSFDKTELSAFISLFMHITHPIGWFNNTQKAYDLRIEQTF